MTTLVLHIYGRLGALVPPQKRNHPYSVVIRGNPSIKNLVEAQGIPHPEVGMILVNGIEKGWEQRVAEGEHIEVFPIKYERGEVQSFVLDVHLGKLAKFLRLLGFDTLYFNQYTDNELYRITLEEDRALLTRDIGLLKRRGITKGYWLRSQNPRQQTKEVISFFAQGDRIHSFTRCMRCNGLLKPLSREETAFPLPPGIYEKYSRFYKCYDCPKIYWKGSHYKHLQSLIEEINS